MINLNEFFYKNEKIVLVSSIGNATILSMPLDLYGYVLKSDASALARVYMHIDLQIKVI